MSGVNGGGDWGRYNVEGLWQMVVGEDAGEAAARALDWHHLAGAVDTEHARLAKACTDLEAAWPAGDNTSAAIFLDVARGLLASMRATVNAASENMCTLNSIAGEIAAARKGVAEARATYGDVEDDIIPEWVDDAQHEANEAARNAMRAAESSVAGLIGLIKVPPLFSTDVSTVKWDEPRGEGGDGGGPADRTGNMSGTGRHRDLQPIPVSVPHTPPPPSFDNNGNPHREDHLSLSDRDSTDGPDLTRVQPAPLPKFGEGAPPLVPNPPGGGLVSDLTAGGLIGTLPAVYGSAQPQAPRGGAASLKPLGVRGAMPSGAVIGGPPPVATSTGTGASRLAPGPGISSGVIGSSGGSARPAGPGIGLNGAPRFGEGREAAHHVGPADNPWEVEEGVSPVIEPERRLHRHDAGAGVIGFDR